MMTIARRFSRRGSLRDASKLDVNNNGTISQAELAKYIEKNAKLWAMLAVNCNLPEAQCRDIATRVAYQLAKYNNYSSQQAADGNNSDCSLMASCEREPTVYEMSDLLDFLNTPQGAQEFFHRTVFAAFDTDNNGYLDYDELDRFLGVFYEAGSIFAGDARLPSKFMLKLNVLMEFDSNGDGKLSFDDMRTLLKGGAQAIR